MGFNEEESVTGLVSRYIYAWFGAWDTITWDTIVLLHKVKYYIGTQILY